MPACLPCPRCVPCRCRPQDKGHAYLNNHLHFTILYHKDAETDLARIVGFEVEPYSIAHKYNGKWGEGGGDAPALTTCNPEEKQYVSDKGPHLQVAEGREVVFTYDVVYKSSEIRWASRWDTYLLATDDQVHWFSIINSLMIVLFLRWVGAPGRSGCGGLPGWSLTGEGRTGQRGCLGGVRCLRHRAHAAARFHHLFTWTPLLSFSSPALPHPPFYSDTGRSGMVAMIMMRTLHRDISKYNQLESAEEAQEETGWKLVHGDVFRPPAAASWLAVLAGTGVQLFGMTLVTMVFATLGFLSPANRGGLMTAVLLLFVFMGSFAGYSSARLYKTFKASGGRGAVPALRVLAVRQPTPAALALSLIGLPLALAPAPAVPHLQGEQWKMTTVRTALTFPAFVSVIFLSLNFLVWGQRSSGAVPFGTLCALVFLWCGISVPLCFVGSYFGYKKAAPEVGLLRVGQEKACMPWQESSCPHRWLAAVPPSQAHLPCRAPHSHPPGRPPARPQDPVRTNKIPRQVPEQPWYMHPVFSILIGGILPFGAVFIELFFILTSMWLQQFYYLFGFLALVFIILIITCAEITIVLAYFQLCSGAGRRQRGGKERGRGGEGWAL